MHDDVGARRVLHASARAPAVVAQRLIGAAEYAAPQRVPGVLLRRKSRGAHEAVPVVGPPVAEPDHVQHAVAIERVVQLIDRWVHGVLGVAEVDAAQIERDLTLDVEVGRVVLDEVRLPRAGAVRMVVVRGKRRRDAPYDLDVHSVNSTCGPGGRAGSGSTRIGEAREA